MVKFAIQPMKKVKSFNKKLLHFLAKKSFQKLQKISWYKGLILLKIYKMDKKGIFIKNSLNIESYFLAGAKFGDIVKIVINPPK